MANPIVQRLIAAGASPQKAQAFATQFTQKIQTAKPTAKTTDIQDAFDEELRSLSEAAYPNAFRPPAVDDPRIDDYIAGLFGTNRLFSMPNACAYDFTTFCPYFFTLVAFLCCNTGDKNAFKSSLYCDFFITSSLFTEVLLSDSYANNTEGYSFTNHCFAFSFI